MEPDAIHNETQKWIDMWSKTRDEIHAQLLLTPIEDRPREDLWKYWMIVSFVNNLRLIQLTIARESK